MPRAAEGSVVVRPGGLADVAVGDVAAFAAAGQLIDARLLADHVDDPADDRTGRIPGSVSVPYDTLLDADGTVGLAGLRGRFEEAGVDLSQPVALTCGGGAAAAFEAALLEGAGVDARLHVGSWSEWVLDPSRRREVG